MENQIEVWKDVKGYEGLYEVSSLGRVRSIERKVKHWRGGLRIKKAKIKQPFKSNCGYVMVGIYKDGTQTNFLVHRLVGKAFIPNPENKEQVNHINGIKTDNRVENLEWNTRSENINHADRNNLRVLKGTNNAGAKLTELQVIQIRNIGNAKSIEEISKSFNVGINCIKKILKRETWNHI